MAKDTDMVNVKSDKRAATQLSNDALKLRVTLRPGDNTVPRTVVEAFRKQIMADPTLTVLERIDEKKSEKTDDKKPDPKTPPVSGLGSNPAKS